MQYCCVAGLKMILFSVNMYVPDRSIFDFKTSFSILTGVVVALC